MIKISSAIFKTFFLSLCIVANTHFAFGQTASILPPGYTQYLDSNGKPLSSGKVYNYVPNTTTLKTTWQDAAETIPNANPVILDAGGRAKILGDGSYRQIVKDRNNNTIWDAVTSSTGSGSTSPTATGDGDLVGTIKPWAGMTAPNQYAFTYGQEVSRTTYSALFTAITSSQSVFCNSGSPTLNGLSDTTNFWIGMSVEVTCVAAGFSTIISKTASTVTLAANANVTTNTNAIFYPWGRGNGTTTFNLPDLRGVVPAGNNNMGGVASANLTATYFGSTDPNSAGALGGTQFNTLTAVNIPGHNHPVFLNDPGHFHTITPGFSGPSAGSTPNTAAGGTLNTDTKTTGITIRDTSGGFGTTNQTNYSGGGIAVSATLGNTGSGYTPGSQTITITGGTCTTQPQFTVTISGGGVFSGTPALLTAGSCTVAPTNPAATSGGGGTGGTLNVTYSAQPVSLIQPTRTTNYIIKITPDANSATANGVTDIQGMTGSIACGSNITCTGNIISFNQSQIAIGDVVANGIFPNLLYINSAGNLGQYSPPYTRLEDYGCTPSSGQDCTTALNNAVAAMINNLTPTTILLSPGTYKFTSKPNDFTVGVKFLCQQGASQTVLNRYYSAGSSTEGFLTWSGSGAIGGGINGCQVVADNTSTNGVMLKFTTGVNVVAGYGNIENVVVSYVGTSDYNYALYIDGSLNTTSGSQGFRDVIVLNSYLFHGFTTLQSVYLNNATNFVGLGVWSNGSVNITGGGTSTTNTTNANYNGISLGTINISNSTLVSLSGQANAITFQNSTSNSCNAAYVPSGNYSDSGTGNLNGGCAIFTGATGGSAGYSGLVPQPTSGQQNNVLVGNGLWQTLPTVLQNVVCNTKGALLEVVAASSSTGCLDPGAAGTVLSGRGANNDPLYTSTPTFGASGTLGSITFGNATSGLLTLAPQNGALGTVTVNLPAINDTLVGLTATQTLTNKTLTSPILTTPNLGVANGTSLALGGAMIGSNALAVTGTSLFNSAITYGSVTLSNSVTGTGSMVLSESPTITSPTFSGTVAGSNTIPLSILAQGGARAIVGNATSGMANLTATGYTAASTDGTIATVHGAITAVNDAACFNDTVGTLKDCGGAPAEVLLNTLTASDSVSLSDTTSLTATYKNYKVVFQNVIPVTNGACLQLTVSTNGGSSYLTTNYISEAAGFNGTSSAADTSTSAILIGGGATNIGCPGNTAGYSGLSGHLYIHNPAGGSLYTAFEGQVAYYSSVPANVIAMLHGFNTTTSAVNAIKFAESSDNISSGVIKIYGMN